MRLIPLTTSTHGAFGPEATRLLSDLGKRARRRWCAYLATRVRDVGGATLRPVHSHGSVNRTQYDAGLPRPYSADGGALLTLPTLSAG